MKKVLHVLLGPMQVGGVSAVVMNYYRHVDRTKIQFDFLTLHNQNKPYVSPYQSEIETLGGKYIKLYTERIRDHFKFCNAIKKILSSEEYIAIHVHGSPSYHILYNLISYYANQYHIPKRIIHSHNDIDKSDIKRNISLSRLYEKCIRFFYPQKINIRFACSNLAGKAMFKNQSFHFIKNAIDTNRFKFDPEQRKILRDSLGISEETKVIGHVGVLLLKQKNQSFLIDIFSELKKINSNVFLILVGYGEDRQIIENKIKQLNLQDSVMLAGLQSQAEKWYNIFDCFVLPSFYEGLPVVAIEAQTAGLPCLLSDTISSDVKITQNLEMLSLSAGAFMWAKKINESLHMNFNRDEGIIMMQKADWDIQSAATQLTQFYLKNTNAPYEF